MFIALLCISLAVAAAVTHSVVKLFDKPLATIFSRIIRDDISSAWHRYVTFAAYVVGISGGVNVYHLEQYIAPPLEGQTIPVLTWERCALEIYRIVIDALQSIAWMYLIVFIFALIAYVIMKGFESWRSREVNGEQSRTTNERA